jgi:hypothetical protein
VETVITVGAIFLNSWSYATQFTGSRFLKQWGEALDRRTVYSATSLTSQRTTSSTGWAKSKKTATRLNITSGVMRTAPRHHAKGQSEYLIKKQSSLRDIASAVRVQMSALLWRSMSPPRVGPGLFFRMAKCTLAHYDPRLSAEHHRVEIALSSPLEKKTSFSRFFYRLQMCRWKNSWQVTGWHWCH